ncbi:hypothetical protein [Roseicyclus marinus]|uniref:hypothetical protein n=1 Tax=Roseicyclus marinus TaxID=2161673 RepID=UPI0024106FE0|nr:hypothetical protein [Roseicyclus marinus]MDG3040463.1 hypothetical protein [Roseicyclus marinus]
MKAIAQRFALFDPSGEPILNAVGIWTDIELVRTYAGTVYGHDGSWQACADAGYKIRRVAITEAEPPAEPDDVALLRAARRILMRGHRDAEVVALALCTVDRLDRDPKMLALSAQIRGAAHAATEWVAG